LGQMRGSHMSGKETKQRGQRKCPDTADKQGGSVLSEPAIDGLTFVPYVQDMTHMRAEEAEFGKTANARRWLCVRPGGCQVGEAETLGGRFGSLDDLLHRALRQVMPDTAPSA
jgi:hypothetical protein